MKNLTNLDQSNYVAMDDYTVARYVKYAQAYAFVDVAPLVWEVKYFRKKTAKKFKTPNDVKQMNFI